MMDFILIWEEVFDLMFKCEKYHDVCYQRYKIAQGETKIHDHNVSYERTLNCYQSIKKRNHDAILENLKQF